MSESIKIYVQVMDREYPVVIDPSEEETIRSIEGYIEEITQKIASDYTVRNNQDVLAMGLIQSLSSLQKKEKEQQELSNQIHKLNKKIKIKLSEVSI